MSYSQQYRRRRAGKTNYHKRLKLLQSRIPRFVVRRSNTSMTCQFIDYVTTGDNVLAAATSADLRKAGITQMGGKSIPASYLVGYLAGKRAAKAGVTKAVVDIGMFTATKGNRLFAAVKGAIDAGIEIPVSDDVLPAQERIDGKHIADHRNITLDIASMKNKLKSP